MGTGFSSLLIANRGEIAIRIARAAAELGLRTVAVHSRGRRRVAARAQGRTRRVALRGRGAAAYLDAEQLVAVAREAGCDAIHPGYGFLSENAGVRPSLRRGGLIFVGPAPERARRCSATRPAPARSPQRCGVPVLRGHDGPDQPGRGARRSWPRWRRGGDDGQGGRRRRRARHAPVHACR